MLDKKQIGKTWIELPKIQAAGEQVSNVILQRPAVKEVEYWKKSLKKSTVLEIKSAWLTQLVGPALFKSQVSAFLPKHSPEKPGPVKSYCDACMRASVSLSPLCDFERFTPAPLWSHGRPPIFDCSKRAFQKA